AKLFLGELGFPHEVVHVAHECAHDLLETRVGCALQLLEHCRGDVLLPLDDHARPVVPGSCVALRSLAPFPEGLKGSNPESMARFATFWWCVILSDLLSPAEARGHSARPGQGFAQAKTPASTFRDHAPGVRPCAAQLAFFLSGSFTASKVANSTL